MRRRPSRRDDRINLALLEDALAQGEGEGAGPGGRQRAAGRRNLEERLATTDAGRAEAGGLLKEGVVQLVVLERELQGGRSIVPPELQGGHTIARLEKELWAVWEEATETLEEVEDPTASNLKTANLETLDEVKDLRNVREPHGCKYQGRELGDAEPRAGRGATAGRCRGRAGGARGGGRGGRGEAEEGGQGGSEHEAADTRRLDRDKKHRA
jgi:hypothetical protein